MKPVMANKAVLKPFKKGAVVAPKKMAAAPSAKAKVMPIALLKIKKMK